MKSQTLPSFWEAYYALPEEIRRSARKSFQLWRDSPFHLADGVKVPLSSEPLKLSKDEWRKRLSAEQFDILREIWNTPRISLMDLLTVPSYN